MRGSAAFRVAVAPGGALAGPWVRNSLWTAARAVPSLDLRFAENKSLVDAVTGAQLVTFNRASSGTFVDSAGVLQTAATDAPRFDHDPTTGESLGLLVEEQRTNNLVQSEDFATTWTLNNVTVSTNTVTAPDGTLTADTFGPVVGDGLTITRFLRQNPVLTTQQAYTFSVFVKVGTATANGIALYISDSTATNNFRANFILFTLTTSVAGSGWATPTATIIPYPNGWYRCILSGVTSTVHTGLRASIYLNTFGNTSDTYGTHHIWGAQLEAGAFPTSYILTTTATVTRAADVASITGTNFGITRTNVVLQSEDFSTTWTNNGSSENVNAIIAPDGTLTADALVDTAVSEIHAFSQSITGLTGSTSYTFSCFMKKGSKDFGVLVFVPNASWAGGAGASVFFNLNTGVVGTTTNATASIQAYPNGWYRCIATATTVASPGTVTARIGSSLTGGSQTYTGAGDEAIYVWGAQLEASSAVTPYIPTTTAAVSVFESSWYNQTEGTVFSEFSAAAYSTASLAISDGTNSNRILIDRGSTGTRYVITNAGIAQSGGAQTPYTLNSFVKTSFGYALDNCNLAVGGALQTVDTSATIPSTLDRLLLGVNASSGSYGNGAIKRFTYWPTRFADTTLQAISQP